MTDEITLEGDVLVVHTTHLKEGWISRNGVPRSDQSTVTEYFIRHGDNLTWMVVIHDPIYLTEPMIRSRDYTYAVAGQIAPYPCESVVETVHDKGYIPHHLPGTNTFLKPGDVMETEIESLGKMRNRLVAESAQPGAA